MIQIWAIAVKELKLLLRDPGGLLLLFVLPAIFILLLSVALQGAFSSRKATDRVDVLVVNDDTGDTGEKIVEALEKTGYFRIVPTLDGRPLNRESVVGELDEGTYRIAVLIPEGASKAVRLESDDQIEILMDPTLSTQFAVITKSTIQNLVFASVLIEVQKKGERMRRLHTAGKKTREKLASRASGFGMAVPINVKRLSKAAKKGADRSMTKARIPGEPDRGDGADKPEKPQEECDDPEDLPGLKVKQTYTLAGGEEVFPNSVQQSVPGWTVFALFWIAQIIAVNLLQERSSGAYSRILVAPVSLFGYVVGKTIPFFIINMLQAVIMFALGVYILPLLGCPELAVPNPFGLVLVTAAISFSAINFGLFMASVSKTSFFVAPVSATILIIMTVIAGIMVPKFVMPLFMQKLAAYVPQGWAFDAYLDLLIRDYSTLQVLPHMGVLILFGLGFGAFAVWRFSIIARKR